MQLEEGSSAALFQNPENGDSGIVNRPHQFWGAFNAMPQKAMSSQTLTISSHFLCKFNFWENQVNQSLWGHYLTKYWPNIDFRLKVCILMLLPTFLGKKKPVCLFLGLIWDKEVNINYYCFNHLFSVSNSKIILTINQILIYHDVEIDK